MIITDKAQIKIAELRESNNLRLSGSDELECYELIESDLKLPADATFTRSSVAYLSDGTQVDVNTPRFEQGKFGKAVMVEEGTTNIYNINQSQGLSPIAFSGATVTVTPNQSDPFGGLNAVRVQASGGTNILKAYYNAYSPANGVAVSGQIWVRNRIATALTLFSNQGSRSATILQSEGWKKIVWQNIIGDGVGIVQHQLRAPTSGDTIDCDVAFLQYEEKPYATSWQIGGTARSPETLTIPTAGVLNPQEGTVECWVYVNGVVRRNIANNWPTVILIHKGTSIANWIWLYHSPNGRWYLQIRKEDGTITGQESFSDSLTLDGWHYFAIRWNAQAGTADLFHNGVKRVSLTGVAFPAEYDRIDVGHRSGGSGDWLNSLIDDLRISNKARSDEEILAAYQNNVPQPVDEWTTYKLSFDDKVRITTQGQIICNELIEI